MTARPMHHLFADDLWGIEFANLTAEEMDMLTKDYTPADRHEGAAARYTAHRAQPLPERHYTAPQGRIEQGWPVRRCSPEMACWDSTQDDQGDSADAEVLTWLLKGLAVVLLACLCAWCIASYLELAHV